MALFGLTEDEPDAAARGVFAALDMVEGVKTLAARWTAAGLPTFDIGVGISSGSVMAGTIGSDRRRELIVVGRPMIAAARIQRMTRLFDAHIIAGEETFNEVKGRVQLSGARDSPAEGHQAARRAVRDPGPGAMTDQPTIL